MRTRGRGGAGPAGRRVPGTAPCRPGPLHPGTAELASCRGTTLPRPQRDPGARAGGNIVPASGQLEREAARRALGGCAGLPAPGGHAPGGAGSPGTRHNLAAAGRVGRQIAFLSPRQSPFLSALQEGISVPQCRDVESELSRSGPRRAVQLPASSGQSERKVLPKLRRWSCKAGPRRSRWNSRATRTATSRSSSTKDSPGSQRSATNK